MSKLPSSASFQLYRLAAWACISCATALLFTACDPTPEDQLTEAKRALASGDLDRAETRLDDLLNAYPQMLEARRVQADAYIRRGEYELARDTLEALWQEQNLEQEGDLTADQRQFRQLLNDQFRKLYHQWAASIDPTEAPERFEAICLAGLERDSRDGKLNQLLVDFYQQRAERHIERNDLVGAAEQLERIDDLYQFPDVRRESRERAATLRRQAFFEEASLRFQDEVQPNLHASQIYDAEAGTLEFSLQPTLGRRIGPDDREARREARQTALQSLEPILKRLAADLAELSTADVEALPVEMPEIRVDDESVQAGQYRATVKIELDELMDLAFQFHEAHRTGAEPSGLEVEDAPEEDSDSAP